MVTARVSRSLEALDLWVPRPPSEKATTQPRAPRQLGLASEVYAGEGEKGAGPFSFATSCQPAAYDNRGPSTRVGQITEKSPCCAVDVVVVVDKTNPRHGGFGFLLA